MRVGAQRAGTLGFAVADAGGDDAGGWALLFDPLIEGGKHVEAAMQLGRPVADATGLKGKYDFNVSWVPEAMTVGAMAPPGPPPPPPGGGPLREGSGAN